MLKLDQVDDNLDEAQASAHSFGSFGGAVGGSTGAPNGSPLGVYDNKMGSRTDKRRIAKKDKQNKREVDNSLCTLCPKVKEASDPE